MNKTAFLGLANLTLMFLMVAEGLWIWQHWGEPREKRAPVVSALPERQTETQDPVRTKHSEDSEKRGPQSVMHTVPFTSQSPYAEWGDERFAYGCEEASTLMAISWAKGEEVTKEEARATIVAASAYQEAEYGTFHDTSVNDTAQRLFEEYFGYSNIAIREDVSKAQLIEELGAGNLLLVPVRGREIGNPHYVTPGPKIHMLVVTGYDEETDEFVTNDPGTRHGETFRYPADVIDEALADYPTGKDEPLSEKRERRVLVVRPADKGMAEEDSFSS